MNAHFSFRTATAPHHAGVGDTPVTLTSVTAPPPGPPPPRRSRGNRRVGPVAIAIGTVCAVGAGLLLLDTLTATESTDSVETGFGETQSLFEARVRASELARTPKVETGFGEAQSLFEARVRATGGVQAPTGPQSGLPSHLQEFEQRGVAVESGKAQRLIDESIEAALTERATAPNPSTGLRPGVPDGYWQPVVSPGPASVGSHDRVESNRARVLYDLSVGQTSVGSYDQVEANRLSVIEDLAEVRPYTPSCVFTAWC